MVRYKYYGSTVNQFIYRINNYLRYIMYGGTALLLGTLIIIFSPLLLLNYLWSFLDEQALQYEYEQRKNK